MNIRNFKAVICLVYAGAIAAVNAFAVSLTIENDTATSFYFSANFLNLGDSSVTSAQGATVSVVELAGNEFQFTVRSSFVDNVFSFFPMLLWNSQNPGYLPVWTNFSEGGGQGSTFSYLTGVTGEYPLWAYDDLGRRSVFEGATFYYSIAATNPTDGGSAVPETVSTVGMMALSFPCLILLRRRFVA